MEKNSLDSILLNMIESTSSDSDLGSEYRKFSLSYFGPFQDALIKTHPDNIELGKKIKNIYSKSLKGKNNY